MVRPVENLGIIMLPFGALTVLLGLLFPTSASLPIPASGRWNCIS
jgi:hypothetical protein